MAETYKLAAAFLSERAAVRPEVGIICGSGLSGLSKSMTDTQTFNYREIPGFPEPTVAGHSGELVFGLLSGVPTVCMRGRFHFYEGHPMSVVVMPVRTMRCLGVKILIVTTASGGLNPQHNVGDVTCIMDHLALPTLSGQHPLIGPNDDSLGPRFIATSNAYSKDMQKAVMNASEALGFNFVRPNGCHCYVSGPTYESPTECKWMRQLGVDTVSMSTVPEVITAHHCGMKIVGLGLITNAVVMPGEDRPAASHQEVLETVEKRATQMQALVARIVEELKPNLRSMPVLPPVDVRAKSDRPTAQLMAVLLAAHLIALTCIATLAKR